MNIHLSETLFLYLNQTLSVALIKLSIAKQKAVNHRNFLLFSFGEEAFEF